jgi:hypothetical protein
MSKRMRRRYASPGRIAPAKSPGSEPATTEHMSIASTSFRVYRPAVRERTRRRASHEEPARELAQAGASLPVERVQALQRSAGNAATARLLRFSRVSGPGKPRSNGRFRLSQNGHYMVEPKSGSMWVHKTAPKPLSCKATGATHPASADYEEYAPSMGFLNDCLHTAEEIVHGKELAQGGDYTKTALTGAAFGDSKTKNIKAAKDYETAASGLGGRAPVNDGASPSPGQAFVIVDTKPATNASGYPYHAAGVIARDGDDAVTMEMFASDEDAMDTDRGDAPPAFEMYGPGATFHSTWSSVYAQPITIVIEKR